MIALVILVAVIALGAVAVVEFKGWMWSRRVNRAIDLVKRENPLVDADALRCSLERDRQRRHHDDTDDTDPPPMALAA